MTLQSSGPIDFGQINVELGLPANTQISLGDTAPRTLSSILTGPISMSNFYSTSNAYGLFSLSAYTDKYIFSNNSVVPGTILGLNRWGLAACGDFSVGIFGGGNTTSDTNYTDKYTYSNNTVAAGTVLGKTRYNISACGDSKVGIISGGYYSLPINYTDIYTYSNATITVGTLLNSARYSLAAVSASPGHF